MVKAVAIYFKTKNDFLRNAGYYKAMSAAVSNFRKARKIEDAWKEKIADDYEKRGKK